MNGLLIRYPNNQEKIISFKTRLLKIGASAACEISIVDNRLPEVAAVIVREPDGVYFKTAHAGELVKFNNEIVSSIIITPGDKIQIGNAVITPLYESDDESTTNYPRHIVVQPPGRGLTPTKTSLADDIMQVLVLRMRAVKMAAALAGGVILAFFCWQILALIFPPPDAGPSLSVENAFPEIMGYLIGGERGSEAASVLRENQDLIKRWKDEFQSKLSDEEQRELLRSLTNGENREQTVRKFFDRSRENSRAVELRDEVKKFVESEEYQQIREKLKSRVKPTEKSVAPAPTKP